jgi:trans-aconitate 2-methyltransferase
MTMWDPDQYQRFAGERSRPFFELVARVGATDPRLVADLGCGPGELTAALASRWPGAEVVGVDSSPEMIRAARALPAAGDTPALAGDHAEDRTGARAGVRAATAGRLSFVLADLREWQPARPVDVIVSNAALQWVPDHLAVLSRWPGMLAAGGWLAFQVPGNFDQPSHQILRELASSQRWRLLLRDVQLNRQAGRPAEYLDLLAGAGCDVDAWETTYLHVLRGADPVLDWYKGTGLRPVLAALGPGLAGEFMAEYGARAREAYPAAPYGTVLPFRRIFVVAARR